MRLQLSDPLLSGGKSSTGVFVCQRSLFLHNPELLLDSLVLTLQSCVVRTQSCNQGRLRGGHLVLVRTAIIELPHFALQLLDNSEAILQLWQHLLQAVVVRSRFLLGTLQVLKARSVACLRRFHLLLRLHQLLPEPVSFLLHTGQLGFRHLGSHAGGSLVVSPWALHRLSGLQCLAKVLNSPLLLKQVGIGLFQCVRQASDVVLSSGGSTQRSIQLLQKACVVRVMRRGCTLPRACAAVWRRQQPHPLFFACHERAFQSLGPSRALRSHHSRLRSGRCDPSSQVVRCGLQSCDAGSQALIQLHHFNFVTLCSGNTLLQQVHFVLDGTATSLRPHSCLLRGSLSHEQCANRKSRSVHQAFQDRQRRRITRSGKFFSLLSVRVTVQLMGMVPVRRHLPHSLHGTLHLQQPLPQAVFKSWQGR